VKAFRREAAGTISTELSAGEAQLIISLAAEVTALVDHADDSMRPIDPALERLFPDAYPTDAEASADFRRFTTADLRERKTRNATTIQATAAPAVDQPGVTAVELDAQQTQAWLRGLNDIRLMLAARLGVGTDGEPDVPADAAKPLMDVYNWLGWAQDSLVRALDD
jgi:hypothetical protein